MHTKIISPRLGVRLNVWQTMSSFSTTSNYRILIYWELYSIILNLCGQSPVNKTINWCYLPSAAFIFTRTVRLAPKALSLCDILIGRERNKVTPTGQFTWVRFAASSDLWQKLDFWHSLIEHPLYCGVFGRVNRKNWRSEESTEVNYWRTNPNLGVKIRSIRRFRMLCYCFYLTKIN